VSERAIAKATIVNKLGLHARPAMVFVDLASTFQSEVKVSKDDYEVDGKSIMMMMMLAAGKGSVLSILAEGPDAEQAVAALKKLVDSGFDED
jgi:phosphocarrier protein